MRSQGETTAQLTNHSMALRCWRRLGGGGPIAHRARPKGNGAAKRPNKRVANATVKLGETTAVSPGRRRNKTCSPVR
eukprot:341336-Heterocapsa_arctica.AAC.1